VIAWYSCQWSVQASCIYFSLYVADAPGPSQMIFLCQSNKNHKGTKTKSGGSKKTSKRSLLPYHCNVVHALGSLIVHQHLPSLWWTSLPIPPPLFSEWPIFAEGEGGVLRVLSDATPKTICTMCLTCGRGGSWGVCTHCGHRDRKMCKSAGNCGCVSRPKKDDQFHGLVLKWCLTHVWWTFEHRAARTSEGWL